MTLVYEDAIRNGEYEKALQLIFEAVEEEPDEEVHYINGGSLLHRIGRDEEAEKFLQKAIALNGASTSAYYTLAGLYFDNERYEEAIRLYLIAYSRNPEDPDLNFMLALSYTHIDDKRRAVQFYEVAHKEKPEDTDITFQYGLLCCQLSLYKQAEILLSEVIEKEPHADACYNLGLVMLMMYDDKKEAVRLFKEAVNIQASHHLAQNALQKLEG